MKDIIIVGCGMAGMTAAVYALRNNKSVLILESTSVGGQIAFSPKVENFPTYRQISGQDLSNKIFEQVLDLGAEFELEDVADVTKDADGFFTVTTDMGTHRSKTVIIATGAKQKHIGIAAEDKLLGKGVYYCAICDGAFYKGKEVALIGDGNTALQSAMLLSSICTKVYVLTWFDKFFGDASLVETIRRTENIIVMPNTNVVDFLGTDRLEGLKVHRRDEGTDFVLSVPAVFVAIGQVPDNGRFSKVVELDKNGYIVTDEGMRGSVPGVFAAGDTRQKAFRQLTTAANDGTIAALGAINYLNSL